MADETIPGTRFKVGRQRIIWDNARFIGNVGFRQNEQTFDAARGAITALPDTVIEYNYLEEVHRIFGTDSPVGDPGLEGHGHPGAVQRLRTRRHHAFRPAARLRIPPASIIWTSRPTASSWKAAMRSTTTWSLLYAGSAAYQEDLADNPGDFDLWYYRVEPGIDYRGYPGQDRLRGPGGRRHERLPDTAGDAAQVQRPD